MMSLSSRRQVPGKRSTMPPICSSAERRTDMLAPSTWSTSRSRPVSAAKLPVRVPSGRSRPTSSSPSCSSPGRPLLARPPTAPDRRVGVAGDDVLEPVGLGVGVVVDEGDDVGARLGHPDRPVTWRACPARRRCGCSARPGKSATTSAVSRCGEESTTTTSSGVRVWRGEVLEADPHVVGAVEGRDDDVDRRGRGVRHGRSIALAARAGDEPGSPVGIRRRRAASSPRPAGLRERVLEQVGRQRPSGSAQRCAGRPRRARHASRRRRRAGARTRRPAPGGRGRRASPRRRRPRASARCRARRRGSRAAGPRRPGCRIPRRARGRRGRSRAVEPGQLLVGEASGEVGTRPAPGVGLGEDRGAATSADDDGADAGRLEGVEGGPEVLVPGEGADAEDPRAPPRARPRDAERSGRAAPSGRRGRSVGHDADPARRDPEHAPAARRR